MTQVYGGLAVGRFTARGVYATAFRHLIKGAVAFAFVCGVGSTGPTHATTDQVIVNCATGGVVQKVQRGQCRGRIVSRNEAAKLQEKRRDYIRNAFQEPLRVEPKRNLKGVGSGFFIDRDGTLLTNYHVVDDCRVLSVSPADGGSEANASIVGYHRGTDLAVLRSSQPAKAIAWFAPQSWPSRGSELGIVGYPDQGIPPLRPLYLEGSTIGPHKVKSGISILAMNAAVRPGNSGGPVLDERGHVVGVVFAKVDTVSLYESTGSVVRDVGYAIPLDLTHRFLKSKGISVRRGSATAAPVDNLLDHARAFVARINCYR